ncbi:MAG: hypothetical protein Ta2B_09480 [Termitinemataceae bacterium]|nr:MAG: hypothetical protein Ta2B_09480 [Termitinemataceae bacterium]
MGTIYEITDDWLALQKLIDDSLEDEDTGEVRELIEDEKKIFTEWADENASDFKRKFEGICKYFKNLKTQAEVATAEKEALNNELSRLRKRASAFENKADRIKSLLWYAFDRIKIQKYKTELFSVGIQATRKTAKPTSLFNADDIPVNYLKRELSTSAINEAIKDGSLYEVDDPQKRGKLFYKKNGVDTELKGVEYTGGQTLVVR